MSSMLYKSGTVAQLIIAALVIVAFMAMGVALIFARTDFPPGIKEVVLIFTGALITSFKDVVGYYLGSSLSSQRKDEIKEFAP